MGEPKRLTVDEVNSHLDGLVGCGTDDCGECLESRDTIAATFAAVEASERRLLAVCESALERLREGDDGTDWMTDRTVERELEAAIAAAKGDGGA